MSELLFCSCDGFCGASEQETGAHVTCRSADGNLPCKQRPHFRGVRRRAKSNLCRQPFNFLSCMHEIRHAIRKQVVRQMCVSFAGIKIAKTTCEQISSNCCLVFLLCPSVKFPRIVFWESIMLPTVASLVWFEGSTFNSKRQFFFSAYWYR